MDTSAVGANVERVFHPVVRFAAIAPLHADRGSKRAKGCSVLNQIDFVTNEVERAGEI